MGGASPYHARFIGLPPCGQPGHGAESAPLGDGGEKCCGLVNMSNTCYVNSVLQALYFCHPFRQHAIGHLTEGRQDDDEHANEDSLLTSLAELFASINSQKRSASYITPRRFLARLRKANDLFDTSEHQDAHEFMQFLLNDIAENLKKKVQRQRERQKRQQQGLGGQRAIAGAVAAAPGEEEEEEEPRTWVHDIFQGYLVNQMKCLCCENVSVRRETFLDLSVDIERHTSIAACLRAFESTELLRAGNKFFCDRCGCLQEAEKRLRIYQLPSVLTLHLKRFKYVERLGRCCRLPYRVVFPLQLRVVEHRPPLQRRQHLAATNGSSASARLRNGTSRGGTVSTVESASAHEGEEAYDEQPPTRLFELRSVVVHIGRDPTRGHYVTVVRSGDHCMLLDDDAVRVVEPEVLRSFYGTAGDTHERHSDRHAARNAANGWSGGSDVGGHDTGGPHSVPLYERSPEGTCCGYLLFYEAVDGHGTENEVGSALDVGSAADWISEDRDLCDSDSSAEAEPRVGGTDRSHFATCDDGEVSQAFEQRCIPRSSRPPSATSSIPTAAAGAQPTAATAVAAAAATAATVGVGAGSATSHLAATGANLGGSTLASNSSLAEALPAGLGSSVAWSSRGEEEGHISGAAAAAMAVGVGGALGGVTRVASSAVGSNTSAGVFGGLSTPGSVVPPTAGAPGGPGPARVQTLTSSSLTPVDIPQADQG